MRDWHEIAAHCRPIEGAVLHPDECVVIRIKGAEWRVRPLQLPRGILYTPEFGEKVSLKQTVDPLGNKPMQDRAEELVAYLGSGPEGLNGVLAVCTYLGELLDQQYSLDPEAKTDLLSFRGEDPPAWYEQTIRHANGMVPQVSILEMAMAMQPEPPVEPEIAPKTRRWFWNR